MSDYYYEPTEDEADAFAVDPVGLPPDPQEAAAAAARELFERDPAGVAQAIAQGAARDTLAAIAPHIAAADEMNRGSVFEVVKSEAERAMDEKYGDSWTPYRHEMYQYLQSRPGLISGPEAMDPQLLAHRLEDTYRAIKPRVDGDEAKRSWEQVKAAGVKEYWQ